MRQSRERRLQSTVVSLGLQCAPMLAKSTHGRLSRRPSRATTSLARASRVQTVRSAAAAGVCVSNHQFRSCSRGQVLGSGMPHLELGEELFDLGVVGVAARGRGGPQLVVQVCRALVPHVSRDVELFQLFRRGVYEGRTLVRRARVRQFVWGRRRVGARTLRGGGVRVQGGLSSLLGLVCYVPRSLCRWL